MATRARRVTLLAVLVVMLIAAVAALALARDVYNYFMYERTQPLNAAVVEDPVIDGQAAYIAANESDQSRPLMLFMHGHGADHEVLTLPRVRGFAQDLVDAGWIVAASDAHDNAWGSEVSQAAYLALHEYVTGRHEVSEVVIVSESMGAIPGLQLLAADAIPDVAGWIGVAPVVNLTSAAAGPPLAEAIGQDIPESQIVEVDPALIDPARLADDELLIYLGDSDEVVSADDARAFADAVGAEIRTCVGAHVARDCYRAEAVIEMAAAR